MSLTRPRPLLRAWRARSHQVPRASLSRNRVVAVVAILAALGVMAPGTASAQTPPAITYQVSPAAPNGQNGWYVTAPTVSWLVDGAASPACPPQTVSDTPGTQLSCSVGGVTASTATLKVDSTPPTISSARTVGSLYGGWYSGAQTPVVVRFTCADATSGIPAGTCPADATYVDEGAGQGGTASVADAAGNRASVTYTDVNIDRTPPAVRVVLVSTNAQTGAQTVRVEATDVCAGSGTPGVTCSGIRSLAYASAPSSAQVIPFFTDSPATPFPRTFAVDLPLIYQPGTTVLNVTAEDRVGNRQTVPLQVPVTVPLPAPGAGGNPANLDPASCRAAPPAGKVAPNHKYLAVAVSGTFRVWARGVSVALDRDASAASDADARGVGNTRDDIGAFSVTSITPNADGTATWRGEVQIRAERPGDPKLTRGRGYTLTFRPVLADGSPAGSGCTVAVVIPHDNGSKPTSL